jgi:putative transposon-encoded protein
MDIKYNMNKRRKKQLRQAFDVAFRIDIEEILDKKISSFGSGTHITLPAKHKGKKAKVIIYQ